MGKKRRLIKKSSKFHRKYASHPRFKFLHPEVENKNVTNDEKVVETPKLGKTIVASKTNNVNPEPVAIEKPKPKVAPKSKVTNTVVEKNTTIKTKRKKTTASKNKKTKRTDTKAI